MDKVNVTAPRDTVPEWAQPQAAVDAPDPNAWTAAQKAFVLNLIEERDVSEQTSEVQTWLQSLADGQRYLTKRAASELIEKLLKLPKKTIVVSGNGIELGHAERFAVGVPAGRYAVEGDDGELKFYNVWVSRDKKRLNVYVCHGPDESDLRYQKTTMGVLNKIKAAGIRDCAIRYGLEIGHCSNCGRRLTNRISRELGIGPVCGGRMFGGDFSDMVHTKRDEIIARGEDPDEELE